MKKIYAKIILLILSVLCVIAALMMPIADADVNRADSDQYLNNIPKGSPIQLDDTCLEIQRRRRTGDRLRWAWFNIKGGSHERSKLDKLCVGEYHHKHSKEKYYYNHCSTDFYGVSVAPGLLRSRGEYYNEY
jgi:hypothetical protein